MRTRSNFGGVIMDTGFWQKVRRYWVHDLQSMLSHILKGFSADTAAAVPGYVLGGVASFSVPWAIGTIAGLAALGLEGTPAFPTYPRVRPRRGPYLNNEVEAYQTLENDRRRGELGPRVAVRCTSCGGKIRGGSTSRYHIHGKYLRAYSCYADVP